MKNSVPTDSEGMRLVEFAGIDKMVEKSTVKGNGETGMWESLTDFQKKSLIAAGALTVVAVGVFAVSRLFSKKSKVEAVQKPDEAEDILKKTKKSKKKKNKKNKGKAAAETGKTEGPADEVLRRKIIESLGSLQTTANTRGSLEQQVLKYIRSLDAEDYSIETRFAGANWIVIYATIALLTATSQEQVQEILNHQNSDMRSAWKMLDFNESRLKQVQDRERAKMLKLDIAQRLKDLDKIVPLFEDMLTICETTTSNEHIVVCFTIAPLLGRWADFIKLGKKLAINGQSLHDFHQATTQRADLPDYEVLYELAKEEVKNVESMSLENVAWKAYDMEQCQIRFDKVESVDETQKKEIEDNFAQQQGWQALQVSPQSKVIRSGGMLQTIGISSVPLAMVGPGREDRVLLEGYAELEHPSLGGKVMQRERYELYPGEDDFWSGKYVVSQIKNSEAKVVMTFDMMLQLKETAFPV